MAPGQCSAMLDDYKSQIAPYVQADPKKLYSYAQFENEVSILKNRLDTRRNSLLNHPKVNQVAPAI